MSFSVAEVRRQFPILERKVHGHPLVYLDSAATALKPLEVIRRISEYSTLETANVHRGAHTLSDEATQTFEDSRVAIAKFLNADPEEIIYVRNTTEGVNLVAQSWGATLGSSDRILLTEMEHHGNVVPWQLLGESKGVGVDVVRIADDGSLDMDDLDRKLKAPVKLFAVTGCSNALGSFTDLKAITKLARSRGIRVLVDAAQLVSQKPIDVRDLDVDFLAFSGHKLFGPTGIGALYVKRALLKDMPPWQGGGSMISSVTFAKTTYNEGPFRFEAGTPHIEGAVGLKAAIEWFSGFNFSEVQAHEKSLLTRATQGLKQIDGVVVYADVVEKGAILSFNLKGAHHSDVGQILDQQGVAVRAGHHCAQPLMARLGVPGTVRASFSLYNDDGDVDRLLAAVKKAKELLV